MHFKFKQNFYQQPEYLKGIWGHAFGEWDYYTNLAVFAVMGHRPRTL